MFTPPQISANLKLDTRSFIFFYYDNKRYKYYNGNRLNISIHPNHSKTLKEKTALLKKLQFEYHKALENGWNPIEIVQHKERTTVKACFISTLSEKLNSPYSITYKRDLKKICEQFLEFLPLRHQEVDIEKLPLELINSFLNQFKSSGRHYMNKRLMLSIFFSDFVRKEVLSKNPVNKTSRQKVKAKLHDIYTDEQIKAIFIFLKANYYNLYLCALITYGCLLRPHQEIRMLKKKHFSQDYLKIQLSGTENKSAKIRTVYIPPYLQQELKTQFNAVEDNDVNLFTLDNGFFNDDYFKTQWSRAKREMLKSGLIEKNQTLYSFRHTAVVNLYRKTKDLNILQQLLGHSDMIVTLKYLRGLGEATNEDLKGHMPELDLD